MRFKREFSPRLELGVALLDPDAVRQREEQVVRQPVAAVPRRNARRTVSSHMVVSARPSRNAIKAFVELSVTSTLVSLKQFFIQRSSIEPLVVTTVLPARLPSERVELFGTGSRPVAL